MLSKKQKIILLFDDSGQQESPFKSDAIQFLSFGLADDGLFNDKIDPLQITPKPDPVEIPVVLFDGVSGTAIFPCEITSTWDITFFSQICSAGTLLSKSAGASTASGDILIDVVGSLLRCYYVSGSTTKITTTTQAPTSDMVKIRYVNTGTAQTVYVDDVEVGSSTHTDTPNTNSNEIYLASRKAFSGFCNVKMALVDTGCANLPMNEAAGTTIFDVSGNENHGEFSATGCSWSTADNIDSYSLTKGFFKTVVTAKNDRPSFIVYGDSLTAQNTLGPDGDDFVSQIGYFNWARTLLPGQVYLKSNAGVGGQKSNDIYARINTDVIDLEPDYVVVCAGRNDVSSDIPLATITANLDSIDTDLTAAGIPHVWITVPPATDDTASRIQLLKDLNTHIKASYTYVADAYSVIDDGSGSPISGLTFDHVHWNSLGAQRVGNLVAVEIQKIISEFPPHEWHDETHSANVATNPRFTSNASGWAAVNSTMNVVESSDYGGFEVELTASADGSAYIREAELVGSGLFAGGDTIRAIAEIEWDGTSSFDNVSWVPFLSVLPQLADLSFETQQLGFGVSPANNVAEKQAAGSAIIYTSEFTLGATISKLIIDLGFYELKAGDKVTIKRFSIWNVTKSASESYPEIPSLLDGSAAANGNQLTNEGVESSGGVWNGATLKLVQQDNTMLDGSAWSDDGVSLDRRDWAFMKAFVSGNENTFFRWGLDAYGSCVLLDACQYDFAKMWTPSEWQVLSNYYAQGTCGGGILVPAEVTAGTGIGPNGEWADNGDGKILLVEDA